MTAATPSLRWFVVQARVGCEKSVSLALRTRITQSSVADQFGEVLVPSEDVIEMRAGQKRRVTKNFFPGYVLVQMATGVDAENPARITNEAWYVVKETPKVTGFLGGRADQPVPISDAEAAKILARTQAPGAAPVMKVLFEKGQSVRVIDGPFNDFTGVVNSVDPEKATVRVDVMVFGRATPVDFTISQVAAA